MIYVYAPIIVSLKFANSPHKNMNNCKNKFNYLKKKLSFGFENVFRLFRVSGEKIISIFPDSEFVVKNQLPFISGSAYNIVWLKKVFTFSELHEVRFRLIGGYR